MSKAQPFKLSGIALPRDALGMLDASISSSIAVSRGRLGTGKKHQARRRR
jgi:hypothetical protein